MSFTFQYKKSLTNTTNTTAAAAAATSSAGSKLTPEQLQKIEENRQRALLKLKTQKSNVTTLQSLNVIPSVPTSSITASNLTSNQSKPQSTMQTLVMQTFNSKMSMHLY